MRTWFSVMAVVVLCLALVIGVACGGGKEKEGGVTKIKYGFGLPMSGLAGALVGIPAVHGYEFTADKIGVFEVAGKQYRWKLIFEDNQGSSASGGVASTTKFIFDQGVDFIFQSGGAASMASLELCEGNGVIIDGGMTTHDFFGPDHPYSMQNANCSAMMVACFYDWLAKTHPEVKKIVVNALDTPIAAAYNEAFQSKLHEYFGFELEIVWVPEATTEYYPVASAVMAKDPDLIVSVSAGGIMDTIWDMGYDGLSVLFGPIMHQSLLESWGWDDCVDHNLIFFSRSGTELRRQGYGLKQ